MVCVCVYYSIYRAIGRAVDDGAAWPRLSDVRLIVGRLHLHVYLLRAVGRSHCRHSDCDGGPVRFPARAASPLVLHFPCVRPLCRSRTSSLSCTSVYGRDFVFVGSNSRASSTPAPATSSFPSRSTRLSTRLLKPSTNFNLLHEVIDFRTTVDACNLRYTPLAFSSDQFNLSTLVEILN